MGAHEERTHFNHTEYSHLVSLNSELVIFSNMHFSPKFYILEVNLPEKSPNEDLPYLEIT